MLDALLVDSMEKDLRSDVPIQDAEIVDLPVVDSLPFPDTLKWADVTSWPDMAADMLIPDAKTSSNLSAKPDSPSTTLADLPPLDLPPPDLPAPDGPVSDGHQPDKWVDPPDLWPAADKSTVDAPLADQFVLPDFLTAPDIQPWPDLNPVKDSAPATDLGPPGHLRQPLQGQDYRLQAVR